MISRSVLALCCFYYLLTPVLLAQTPLTVAVLPFETTLDNKELKGLDRALSEMLMTDLSKVNSIQVVERGRLHEVIKELKLPSEGFIDPETAATIGKGVGAKAILTGSFHTQSTRMRIDARLIHVETGKIIVAEEITGETDDPFELEKRLQQKIVESLGIKLSKFEETELSTKPTQNIKAAAAFGRATAFQDTGDILGAKSELSEALKDDPDFELAKKLSERIECILNELENERFNALIERIVNFEIAFYDWPQRQESKGDGFSITFNEEGYQTALDAGLPDQMLFWWCSSRIGKRRLGSGNFLTTLFGGPSDIGKPWKPGIVDDYSSVGAHHINLFWCDVYSSVPKFVPMQQDAKVDYEDFVDSGSKNFQLWCFAMHRNVLFTKSNALLSLIKMQEATETAEKMTRVFKGRHPRSQQTEGEQLLRTINAISNDPQKRSEYREQMKVDAFVWAAAEKRIIDRIAKEQPLLIEQKKYGLAISAKPEHAHSFGEVLGSSVTPDIKLSAILSLRYIGNEQAAGILANAETQEPYYFVRHWITAARIGLEQSGQANR